MVTKDLKQSPNVSSKISSKQTLNQAENSLNSAKNDANNTSMFSPRFKSAAAMAGWDEETLLLASLVVEDTPDRNFKDKKRSDSNTSGSRRNRRVRRRSGASIQVTVFNLDDDESENTDGVIEKKAESDNVKSNAAQEVQTDEKPKPSSSDSASCSSSTPPCMDRLREELSCAICLEICFEPSTTPCGHSFCKKCLRSAADKCGKRCPKCRQLISNGRSCNVNTILWNTIQLLFPQEVQARKEAGALSGREAERQAPEKSRQANSSLHHVSGRRMVREGEATLVSSRRGMPSQDEDAAMALRLQREEFMEIYRGRSSSARDNLRAMAQRAINNRVRTRPV